MTSNALGPRYQLASRETRLVNEIAEMLATIRRASEGSYLEALALLQQARVPTAITRLRQTNLLTLRAGHSLLVGFMAEALRVANVEVPSYQRATLDTAGIDGGLGANTTIPFSMLGADGNLYDAFVAIGSGGSGSRAIFGAFEQNNASGTTTNIDEVQDTDTAAPIVSKHHDQEVFVRSVMTALHNIFPCSIDNTGTPVIGAAVNTAPLTAIGDDRPVTRDYNDGRYMWCITQDNAGPDIRVHKVNLDDGTEEGYYDITACAVGVGPCLVFAYNDDAVAIVEDAAGVLRATYFTIADGAGAVGSTAAAAGTALQTPGGAELEATSLLISAPFDPVAGIPSGIRMFLVHDGTDPHEPLQRVDIYPAQGAAGNVSTGIRGLNTLVANGETAISPDGEHILAVDDTANLVALYNVPQGEEVKVIDTTWLGAVNQVGQPTVGPILVNVTQGGAETILAVGIG